MVLVSTERIKATAASDITTSAISAKNSTTPRCLYAGAVRCTILFGNDFIACPLPRSCCAAE